MPVLQVHFAIVVTNILCNLKFCTSVHCITKASLNYVRLHIVYFLFSRGRQG